MPLKSKTPLKTKTPLKARDPIPKVSIKPKKQVKPTITKLRKEADKWWSLATRYRFATFTNGSWEAECITCNQTKPLKSLQCGHFMSRAHNTTRFSEENTAPQCFGCNVMQQGKQYQFGMWVDRMYGDGTAKRLYEESRVSHQFKVEELQQIIQDAKTQVQFYEHQT